MKYFEKIENSQSEVILINGYCNNEEKINVCLNLIESLRRFNVPIVYVSSYPSDRRIIESVDYNLNQRRNLIYESNRVRFVQTSFDFGDEIIRINNSSPETGLAHLDLIFKGIHFAQMLGFKSFHSFTFDVNSDYDCLNNYLNRSRTELSNGKLGFFKLHTCQQDNTDKEDKYDVIDCLVFSGDVNFFCQDVLLRKVFTYPYFDDLNVRHKLVTKYWPGEHFMAAIFRDYFNFEFFHVERSNMNFGYSLISYYKANDRIYHDNINNKIVSIQIDHPDTQNFTVNNTELSYTYEYKLNKYNNTNYYKVIMDVVEEGDYKITNKSDGKSFDFKVNQEFKSNNNLIQFLNVVSNTAE